MRRRRVRALLRLPVLSASARRRRRCRAPTPRPLLQCRRLVVPRALFTPSPRPPAPPHPPHHHPGGAGYFLTKIFPPNISKAGEICVNTLKKDWKPDLGIGHVLQARATRTHAQPARASLRSRPRALTLALPGHTLAGGALPADQPLPRVCPQRGGGQGLHGGLRRGDASAAARLCRRACEEPPPFHHHHHPTHAAPPPPQYHKTAKMLTEIHAMPKKAEAVAAEGAEPVEKRQKPVEVKAAEKRLAQKKKSLKRL